MKDNNMKYTFEKDGATKFVTKDYIADKLIDMGWTCEEYAAPKASDDNELDALKAEAIELGLKPHHKAKAETIKQMIEEAKANDDSE